MKEFVLKRPLFCACVFSLAVAIILAISGIGSAALVAPVIVAVKKLIEKINIAELKQKLETGKNKMVEGTKKVYNAGKEKASEMKERAKSRSAVNQASKAMKLEMYKLFSDFNKSGMTVEEYCEKNELTEYQISILKAHVELIEEKNAKMTNRKGAK